jgi:RimJ/RimL family protein N-acetyltransferase
MTFDVPDAQRPTGRSGHMRCLPASGFSLETLTEIYNAARADYLVPMQMTVEGMRRYVSRYDVDLQGSVVVVGDGEPAGLGMLATRGGQGWITRLGIVPRWRRRAAGHLLAATLVERARERELERLELEVIRDNRAARRLFARLGFQPSRELAVGRREWGSLQDAFPIVSGSVVPLGRRDTLARLASREAGASWLTQTESFEKMSRLRGYETTGRWGARGWMAFRVGSREIDHLVLGGRAVADERIGLRLLGRLHADHPAKRTTVQNVPVDQAAWSVFQRAGYVEEFRRIELFLALERDLEPEQLPRADRP